MGSQVRFFYKNPAKKLQPGSQARFFADIRDRRTPRGVPSPDLCRRSQIIAEEDWGPEEDGPTYKDEPDINLIYGYSEESEFY